MKVMTKKVTVTAMLCAISVAFVSLVHFPIIPIAPFLIYDPADIPIIIATFALGPVTGFIITVVVSTIQSITVSSGSGIYGAFMHILSTGCFVLVCGTIYSRHKTRKTAIIALSTATFSMTATMAFANLVVTPLFLGTSVDSVIGLLLTAIIPFNMIKAGVNSLVSFIIYKSVSPTLKDMW